MNRLLLALISIILLNSNPTFSQDSDWSTSNLFGRQIEEKVSKTEGYMTFTVDSVTNVTERNDVVEKTKKYIAQNLELIGESKLTDSIDLMLVRDKDGMEAMKQFKFPSTSLVKGEQGVPVNLVMCVYTEKRDAIKGGMMSMIVKLKWGLPKEHTLKWLSEGLATLVDPNMDTCDGQTLEERYVYFLQSDKLLDKNILLQFENMDTIPQLKIAQNQSAYIVDHLLKKYGAEKLKAVWQKGMDSFEEIYGFSFEKMVENINAELNRKYPNPIDFNWEDFEKECFLASIYADWHPLYLRYGSENVTPMESKMAGNIRYTVATIMSMDMREEAIIKTKEYIVKNLELINETELNDSLHLILARDKEEMYKYTGSNVSGKFYPAYCLGINYVYCLYREERSPLKHELMHLAVFCKWGMPRGGNFDWVNEGLAGCASPEILLCDDYTIEEKYAVFLQNERLVHIDSLVNYFREDLDAENRDISRLRIQYNQSAYIVQYMMDNYGIDKIKELWQSGMGDFERIFEIKIEDMILKINVELAEKYPNPIEFDWKEFEKIPAIIEQSGNKLIIKLAIQMKRRAWIRKLWQTTEVFNFKES